MLRSTLRVVDQELGVADFLEGDFPSLDAAALGKTFGHDLATVAVEEPDLGDVELEGDRHPKREGFVDQRSRRPVSVWRVAGLLCFRLGSSSRDGV